MRVRDALIVVAALCFMAVALVTQWEQIETAEWHLRPGLFAASLIALVAVFFADAFGWHLVLRALDVHAPVPVTVRIWMLSSLTRYIPGGIWPYASRVTLSRRAGIGAATVSVSLYLETLLLMSSSLAAGIPALAATSGLPFGALEVVILWALLGALMHPRLLQLLHRLPGPIGAAFAAVPLPRANALFGLYAYYVLFWVGFGAAFVTLALSLHPLEPSGFAVAGSAFALAFCVGFVVVFVPGGIGLRESVLYLLLLGVIPASASLVLAVASRLWVILGEIVSLGLALLWKRRADRQADTRQSGA